VELTLFEIRYIPIQSQVLFILLFNNLSTKSLYSIYMYDYVFIAQYLIVWSSKRHKNIGVIMQISFNLSRILLFQPGLARTQQFYTVRLNQKIGVPFWSLKSSFTFMCKNDETEVYITSFLSD
jgi:hypothetical protein